MRFKYTDKFFIWKIIFECLERCINFRWMMRVIRIIKRVFCFLFPKSFILLHAPRYEAKTVSAVFFEMPRIFATCPMPLPHLIGYIHQICQVSAQHSEEKNEQRGFVSYAFPRPQFFLNSDQGRFNLYFLEDSKRSKYQSR